MIASEQAQSSDFAFMALFARMDNVAMAVATSLLFAVGLPTATVVLLLLGAPPGVPIGPNLSALGNILPGYSVTWLGSLIGAFWGAVLGAVVGFLIAAFWNFSHVVFTGLSALSYQHHISVADTPSSICKRPAKVDSKRDAITIGGYSA